MDAPEHADIDLVPQARCGACSHRGPSDDFWTVHAPGTSEPMRVCRACWERSRVGGAGAVVRPRGDVDALLAAYVDAHPDLDAHRDRMTALADAARAERHAVQELVLLGVVRGGDGTD